MALVDLQDVKDRLWITTSADDTRLTAHLNDVLDLANKVLGDLSRGDKTIVVNVDSLWWNRIWLKHVNPISLKTINGEDFSSPAKVEGTDYIINPDGMAIIPDLYLYTTNDFGYISVTYVAWWNVVEAVADDPETEEDETVVAVDEVPNDFKRMVATAVGWLYAQDLWRDVLEESTGPHKTVFWSNSSNANREDVLKKFKKELRKYIPTHLKIW